jgi:glyoxylase-like metal-dependent hydrolase (beta-lactamase superfamily II)
MRSGMSYTPFQLDRALEADLDLAELGVEGRILQLPGHTPGSLGVVFDFMRDQPGS